MAQSEHLASQFQCPLSEVKQTSRDYTQMAAFDPKDITPSRQRDTLPTTALGRCMRRREFIRLFDGALATAPGIARAQSGKRVPTVAYLWHAGSAKEDYP